MGQPILWPMTKTNASNARLCIIRAGNIANNPGGARSWEDAALEDLATLPKRKGLVRANTLANIQGNQEHANRLWLAVAIELLRGLR